MPKETHLKKGDKAPNFSVNNQDEEILSLTDYKGKKLVLYFYPKDNTPTCTTESCNLRDNYKKLQKEGYEVLGISPDSEKSHRKFIDKYDLPFDLLADTDHSIAEDYGVWGEKQMFGKKYNGIFRTTFLINEKGIIEEVITKVKSKIHAEQILPESP